MPALQFRREYVDLIRRGVKTQTVRAKLSGGFVVGRRLRLHNGYHSDAHIGDATITEVVLVDVAELTESDARLDGFESLDGLRVALADTYPRARKAYRVRWHDFTPAR